MYGARRSYRENVSMIASAIASAFSSAIVSLTRRPQSLAQAGNVARPEIALAIDEDRRCTVDAVRSSAHHVSFHAFRESVGLDRRAQRSRIDTRLGAPTLEPRPVELVLMAEQPVVHDPECIGTGERVDRLGGFRGHLRMRMYFPEREVAKYRTKGVRLETPQSDERQLERTGVRTLVVAVDQHRSRGCVG